MYKHLNNTVVNSYWEAKLPKGYNKPGQNASSQEVEQFIRDKYINKRWVENIKAGDPAWLYWNDRKKFDKYLKKLQEGAAADAPNEDDEDEPKHKKSKKSKKSKKHQSDSEEEEDEPQTIPTIGKASATTTAQVHLKAPPVKTPIGPVGDLINLDAGSSVVAPAKGGIIDGFLDFQDANPMKSTDNDFSDF